MPGEGPPTIRERSSPLLSPDLDFQGQDHDNPQRKLADPNHRCAPSEAPAGPTPAGVLHSTQIILGYDRAVAWWVHQHLADPPADWGSCTTIGIARGGDLIAGVVFNNFCWPNIEGSIASTTPRWCSRRNLAAIFAYPFRQLDCHRMGATTGVTNQPVRAFLCRLGFREEGVCRQAWPPSVANPTGDAVLYGMTPDECRWLAAK
jgi:RimJ/RimL family protein N-acetyltransferase